jgi:hypothetical protein
MSKRLQHSDLAGDPHVANEIWWTEIVGKTFPDIYVGIDMRKILGYKSKGQSKKLKDNWERTVAKNERQTEINQDV